MARPGHLMLNFEQRRPYLQLFLHLYIYSRYIGGLLNKKTFPARQRLSRGFAKAQVQILGICKNQYVTNQNYFRHWLVQIKNSQADAGMLKKGHFNFLTYSLLLAPCSAPPQKSHIFQPQACIVSGWQGTELDCRHKYI